MTLPASGAISMAQVLAELQIAAPTRAGPLSLNDADVRALAGVPSGAISMSDLYGKSSAYVVNPLVMPQVFQSRIGTSATVWVNFYTDGTIQGFITPNDLQWTRSWRVPTLAGIGASYYIKATLASGLAPNGSGDPALNTWHSLSAVRGWAYITSGGVYSSRSGTLNIYISTSASDAGIVASGTVYLFAERES